MCGLDSYGSSGYKFRDSIKGRGIFWSSEGWTEKHVNLQTGEE
jgi:hypothetical protein